MIGKRVRSALVIAPLVFAAAWFGGAFFAIVVAAIAGLGALEFYSMLSFPKRHPLTQFGLLCILLFIILAHFEGPYTASLLASAVVLSLVWLIFRSSAKSSHMNWAWTIAGILCLGWMFSRLIPLRALADGREWVIFTLFAIFAADTSAFFIGRAWGRHAMAPTISPGKTWEGAIGGLVGAVAASLVLAAILSFPIPSWQAVILGVLVGVFSQLGDLAESMLKRKVGVKDSGALIPGHGGILDRLDSVVFTVVVVYYYVIWVLV